MKSEAEPLTEMQVQCSVRHKDCQSKVTHMQASNVRTSRSALTHCNCSLQVGTNSSFGAGQEQGEGNGQQGPAGTTNFGQGTKQASGPNQHTTGDPVQDEEARKASKARWGLFAA